MTPTRMVALLLAGALITSAPRSWTVLMGHLWGSALTFVPIAGKKS